MRGGRWKIFKGQNHVWLEEHRVYHRDANGRVVAENDDAISASRYGMMMRRHARVEDVKAAFSGRLNIQTPRLFDGSLLLIHLCHSYRRLQLSL